MAAMMAVANEAHQLDVMRLSVAQLKAELRKRGRGTGGNKSTMQVRLKEAIDLNVPVLEESGGNEARRPDFMTGLDVTAKWELLTRCDDPIPEPDNDDGNLQPPTEMNANPNPKAKEVGRPQHRLPQLVWAGRDEPSNGLVHGPHAVDAR